MAQACCLYCMCNGNKASSLLLAPAWHAEHVLSASCRVTVEDGGPGAKQQATMLYDLWLLDVPKLMDLAVLYGQDNATLLLQFMQQVSGRLLAQRHIHYL